MLGALGFIGRNLINGSTAKEEPTVNHMHASYAIDVESKEEVVGSADYVFVAKVVDEVRTEYRHPITMETEYGGTKEVASPYTIYSIEVIDNIKGKLQKNKPFDIAKSGGISEKGDTVYIFEADELPQENKYYIMMGYAQPDGTILVSGANSNILLNGTDKQDIVSSKEYKEYKKALQNEVKSKRERFTSTFEE